MEHVYRKMGYIVEIGCEGTWKDGEEQSRRSIMMTLDGPRTQSGSVEHSNKRDEDLLGDL